VAEEDLTALAHWLFDRARAGETAAFKGYPDVVRVLVAAGADPDLGSPTARAAADFFQRPDLPALLQPGP
jgi:hypothetical protein